MSEATDFDLQELLDVSESVVAHFLSIEKRSFHLTPSDYDSIFRGLHNLKGTFAMLGLPSELVQLVQETETLFEANKGKDSIQKPDFQVLYKSSTEIHEFLESGKMPKTFDQIKKCSLCLEDPIRHKPESCKNNEKNLIDYNEGLGIFKQIQAPVGPRIVNSVLVIKSSFCFGPQIRLPIVNS